MTDFEKLNPPREDGFPKVKELKATEPFKTNAKESDFDKPILNLEKEY